MTHFKHEQIIGSRSYFPYALDFVIGFYEWFDEQVTTLQTSPEANELVNHSDNEAHERASKSSSYSVKDRLFTSRDQEAILKDLEEQLGFFQNKKHFLESQLEKNKIDSNLKVHRDIQIRQFDEQLAFLKARVEELNQTHEEKTILYHKTVHHLNRLKQLSEEEKEKHEDGRIVSFFNWIKTIIFSPFTSNKSIKKEPGDVELLENKREQLCQDILELNDSLKDTTNDYYDLMQQKGELKIELIHSKNPQELLAENHSLKEQLKEVEGKIFQLRVKKEKLDEAKPDSSLGLVDMMNVLASNLLSYLEDKDEDENVLYQSGWVKL